MDYVRSNKGGMKLLFQNNLYVKQKVLSSGAVCWECDQRRNKFACKAKLHVLDNQTTGDLRRFQANVGAYHPNFWKFIDILKGEQSLNHVNISQARAGHQPEPQRRRYQDSNRRIKNIVQDYHNRDRLQYLRGLAHNISM